MSRQVFLDGRDLRFGSHDQGDTGAAPAHDAKKHPRFDSRLWVT